MSITQADLQKLAVTSLDHYLKNNPIDQVTQDKPFLNKIIKNKKPLGGAKQFIKETVRYAHDSNFNWMYGEDQITFHKRDTVTQAEFPWRHCVDSIYRSDDELFSNGIKVVRGDAGKFKLERSEKVQIIDQLEEDNANLREGFFEKLDFEPHRDGTADADAVVGLDGLISLTPTTGTVGGIDRATKAYWRNYAKTGIAAANVAAEMETAWRECTRYSGGQSPDFILCGWDFIQAYKSCLTITNNANAGEAKRIDAGVGTGSKTGLFFKGVELIWDPTFDALDTAETPSTAWSKRCYMLNSKKFKWYEDGLDVFSPEGPHNTLCLFTVASLRCVLSVNQMNSNAVLALS